MNVRMMIPGSRNATLLFALVLAVLWVSRAAIAEDMPSITVHGTGSVEARPDMAIFSAGAVSRAESVATALAENNETVAKILALAAVSGIAAADLQTGGISIHPVFEESRDDAGLPAIVGHNVANMVVIQLRNLDGLGDFLDKLAAVGANEIGDIRFAVSNRETLLQQARRRAVVDARSKAALYAEEAGVTLGRVIRISEIMPSSPHWERGMAMNKSFGAVPVAAGSLDIQVSLTISFAIGKPG